MVSEKLQKKIDSAINLIRGFKPHDGTALEVAYSGGKDSDILLQLVKEAGVKYRAIYKCTTIDPPGTIKHVLEMGVEIVRPKQTFAQLIAKKGTPSRVRRFCCEKLKEYKILDRCAVGVRAAESAARTKRYKEPSKCRTYGANDSVEQFYPILWWTLDDVVEFARDRNLKFAPVYYDENGVFHPERRLGCMCCPLASKKQRIEQFRRYPGMIKLYLKALQKYIDSHPNSKVAKTYTCYEAFAHDVLFSRKGEWEKVNDPGLFGERLDWKHELEQYFQIELPSY